MPNGYDADGGVGGQDLLDPRLLGVDAGNFAGRVTIAAQGANTLITIDNSDVVGINRTTLGAIVIAGLAPASFTARDFILV